MDVLREDGEPPAIRHVGLDAIRGIAVLGILLLNAFSFTMPDAGYVNPLAYGGTGPLDIAGWFAGFVLFEGKMRGLFSLLFGASLALVVDAARARGGKGGSVHYSRMGWLLVFGLAHHFLVWEGDILVQYALVGALAYLFVSVSRHALRRWTIGLLIASVLVHGAMMGATYFLEANAQAPGATPQLQRQYADTIASFSQPGSSGVRDDLATYRSDYPRIFADRADQATGTILSTFFLFFFETLGLMVGGILGYRNGFLTGGWDAARYRRWAVRAYLLGIPPLIALAAWNVSTGFDVLDVFATFFAWAEPFKYAVLLGHAALAMLLIGRFPFAWMTTRLAAVGRMAFTNYLATSIVMTTVFYGYGLGLYGTVGRAEIYLFVFAMWAAMLAWSAPWLAAFRYGPFEWAWRSLSRGKAQPMRIAATG